MQDGELHLQALLDAMPAAAAVVRADGIVLAVNAAWRDTGCDPAVAVGRDFLDACRRAFAGAPSHAALEAIGEVLDGRRDVFAVECTAAGSAPQPCLALRVVQVAGHGAVVSHTQASGHPAAQGAAWHEESGARRADAALLRREQDLATAFRVNPQPMFIVRAADMRYVEVNEPWERLTGYPRSEAIGRTSAELGLYGDEHDRAQFYARLQREGKVREYEFETRHRDGTLRHVAVSAEIVDIGGEACVIGAVSDITERRQIEAERARLLEAEREARREAERANQIKDEFLATVSHELRTPLNAMLGWAHILARRGADAAMLQEGLSAIERNARAQAQLVADLLDMSRIVSGKLRLDMESVDLHEVVAAAMETVGPAAQAKGIRMLRSLDPGVGPVHGDAQRLQQVVWNLLSNAVKFTPRGGEVEVKLIRAARAARICVSDTGQGIGPDLLPHVFDRFRQADGSTTRRHGGLGLGLAIVKQLVELHGGAVHAHSAGAGLGASFHIELPLPQPEAMLPGVALVRQPGAALTVPVEPALMLTGLTVLAVDDELDALAVVRELLEERHAQVLTATSADEALALIARRSPDVLLSDIGMPDVDGYELIRRIRASERGGRLPAAALTAYARAEDAARALRAGYQAHLAKPLQPEVLVETVALLAGRLSVGH